MSEELDRAMLWLETQADVNRKYIEVNADMGGGVSDINYPAVLLERIVALKEATEVLAKLAIEFSGTPPERVLEILSEVENGGG